MAAVFFRYDVCDIDFYSEVAIAIPVQPVRHGQLGFVDLLAALGSDHLGAYVLSLPVSTHIVQVRGRHGY